MCYIWCGVYEQNMSVRVVEYVFTWPHESHWWRMIVLRTSTSLNIANGSSILTVVYFSSPWRYQLEIFTVCPRTQKLNFLRFLRACDRLSWCCECFLVTFGMHLVILGIGNIFKTNHRKMVNIQSSYVSTIPSLHRHLNKNLKNFLQIWKIIDTNKILRAGLSIVN